MEGERKKSMYRKDSEGWLKHTDFIILDMICLQLAYVLAYAISGYGFNPYETIIYRNMAVFLELADLVMIFAYGTMKSVLKRGYYRDFVVTLNHAIMVGALAVLYLFLLHAGTGLFKINIDADHNNLFSNDVYCQRTLEKTSAKTDEGWRRT